MDQMKYLKELAVRYPNVAAASTEIINLQAILHLPKGTEHYVSDVHGEYEKFSHIIRNGSGAIRSRIEDEFGNTLTTKQKKNLASVIYYPEQKMDLMEEELPKNFLLEWQHDTMVRLVHVARSVGNKYTRSKVRKAMSPEFAYVMEELMVEHRRADKKRYVEQILETIITTGRVRQFIAAVRKYTDMQQLDASVLREFVEKIYISEVYTPDENEPRIKVREIEIVYNFIGAFDFEEAREQSQAAQKEKKTGVA